MRILTRDSSASGQLLSYRAYVLLMAILLYVVAYVDRGVVATVVEPLKAEFGLPDSRIGTILGVVFTVPMALALMPAGYLADRYNRRNILVIAVTAWCVLTVASGFATSVGHLIVLRGAIAVAEAFFYTTAPPIVAGYYDQTGRLQALSRLHVAVGVGSLVGVPLVASAAQAFGWRAGFIASGLPGLALVAIFAFTVREPAREARTGPSGGGRGASMGEVFQVFRAQRSLICFMVGNTMSALVFAGCAAWMMPFLMRVHGLSLVEGGYTVSVSMGAAGVVGYFFGGSLAGRVARNDKRRLALMPAVISMVSFCMLLTAAFASSIWLSIAAITTWALANALVTGPSMGLLYSLTPSAMHGRMAAFNSLLLSVVGAGMGPLLVGTLSEMRAPDLGARSLSFAFAAITPLLLCAMVLYWLAARTVAQDLDRAAADFPEIGELGKQTRPVPAAAGDRSLGRPGIGL